VNLAPVPPFGASRAAMRFLVFGVALSCVLFARRSLAVDRNAESAAKQAMSLALKDHAAGDDDGAVVRLQKARRACGGNRCSPFVQAALLRDLGAVEFLRGDRGKASGLFSDALDLVANLPWNPAFDASEVAAEWSAVKNERAALHEAPIKGDLDHVPAAEQAVDTPLPIYAELDVSGVAKVVVKYKVPGDDEFRPRTLRRFGGGWGGTIPCHDVKRGLLRYFLQAFDADGVPLANSGDVRHLYVVPIRWALQGEPPHLPGQSPPEPCAAGAAPEPEAAEPGSTPGAVGRARYVHLWIGIAGSIDLTTVPSGSDVCVSPSSSGFYCTTPYGADFPNGLTPASGGSGNSSGGPTSGNLRILATIDYAVNTHFLTGARFGYVMNSFPGAAASTAGHEISVPVHLELRETYLFGHEPLASSGFAPYGFVSAGYAKIDASQSSSAQYAGVDGQRPVEVWRMGGPFFVAAGGGLRYAFSPRVAFLVGLKAAVPFGSAGVLPTLAPEVELQYGF
jgi:hypothetical protein